jgi:hypothetical protein
MNIKKEYAFVKNMQVIDQLKEQEADLQRIGGAAASMTVFEKEQARQRIQQKKEAMRGQVVAALSYDWEMVKAEYKSLKVEKAAAAARAARGWDFPRLQYDRQRAADVLKRTKDPEELAKEFEKITIDGDRSLTRAFAEEALATLDTKGLTDSKLAKALDVQGKLKKTVEDLTVSQEQKDLAQQGGILTGKIATLDEATTRLMNEYHKNDGFGTDTTPFTNLQAGVRVTRKVSPVDLATTTEVDLDWD